MIFIKMTGADQVLSIEISSGLEKALKKAGIKDDIAFICPNSFFVHAGQEQTSYHLLVEVLLDKKNTGLEDTIAEVLSKRLSDLSVHSHIIFQLFENEKDYVNKDYPEYLTADNMVHIDQGEDENEDEEEETDSQDIYYGNAFEELDRYVKDHPEMTKDEATVSYYANKTKEAKRDLEKEEAEYKNK